MQQSFTRLSLATALLMGAAFPVLAQGTIPGTSAAPAQRPAVTSTAPAATPTLPGAVQAVRPSTPATTPAPSANRATPAPTASGGTQAARPATPAQPGTAVQAPAPRQGASRATTGHSHQARNLVRHGHRSAARVG